MIRFRSLLLALLVALPASALTVTNESAELLVTSEGTYRAANTAPETTSAAFADGKVFVVFAACAEGDCAPASSASCGVEGSGGSPAPGPYTGLRIRAYDLATGAWDASLEAISKADLVSEAAYHEMPALAAQGGLLHVLDPKRTYALDCTDGAGDEGAPVRYRTLPLDTWRSSATWSSVACAPAGVDLSSGTSRRDCIVSNDLDALVTSGGDLVVAAEGSLWNDTANAGAGRWLWKRSAGGSWSGPFQALKAPANLAGLSGAGCSPSGAGNYFAKGRIVERAGVLYLAWIVQRSFTNSPACNGSDGVCRHAYDVSVVKSTNGGTTWTDLAGGNSFALSDAASSGVDVTSTAYRVWTGSLDQTAAVSVDVDSLGRLAIVVPKYVSGGSVVCGRPDTNDTGNRPTSDLVLLRQQADGTFAEVTIDSARSWFNEGARPLFDALDRLWVFKEGSGNGDTGGSPDGLAYKVSTDGGVTFPAAWTSFGDLAVHGGDGITPERLSVYPSGDRRRAAILYSGGGGELYMKVFGIAEQTLAPVRR